MIKHIFYGSQEIVAAYLNNELIYSATPAKFNPLSLFVNGELGAWYEAVDAATLFQDTALSTPATKAGDPIGATLDKSGNDWHATQPISARRPTYEQAPDRLQLDKADDELVINMPSKFVGTMVLATTIGTASYGVSIPAGDFKLGSRYFPSDDIVGVLLRDGALTDSEQENTEGYFVENGAVADFSAVTDFGSFWFVQAHLTSFPLIDTSSATNFYNAWNSCSSLTSFPLIDTSSATNFSRAWSYCSSLTSFPLLDMSSVESFYKAWFACTSLTDLPAHAFDNVKSGRFNSTFMQTNLNQESIDGILVSLVASGIADGARQFDQSGGSAPSATGNQAIDTLRARGWAISVTGGY
ncbi:hypothetical protein [Psychrobacter sp. W2-37-MNA-CIBAN-0211]|uniref:hypothetical protein n=1 Tax=Psychrobacter sp. W2-37-MNA-CIBAN-0211 TaxID=3140443 RepID=UPI00332F7898